MRVRTGYLAVTLAAAIGLATNPVDGFSSGPAVPIRLSHRVENGVSLDDYRISPDNQWVAYTTGGMSAVNELWVNSIADGTPARVAQNNQRGTYLPDAPAYRFTADSAYLVYGSEGLKGLLARPVNLGSSAVAITPGFQPGGIIEAYQVAPDGLNVFYRADQDLEDVFELYRTSVLGGPSVKVSLDLVLNGDVTGFALSPDGTRIVYVADAAVDERFELYSMLLDGLVGDTVQISHAESENRSVVGAFRFGGAGRVVFESRPLSGYQSSLFSVPIDGSLSPEALVPSTLTYLGRYDLDPDAATIVYSAYPTGGGAYGLYIAPVIGPAVSYEKIAGYSSWVNNLHFIAGGHRILWVESQSGPYVGGLWSAPLPGASGSKRRIGEAGDPRYFATFASSRVVYPTSGMMETVDLESDAGAVLLDSTVGGVIGPRFMAWTRDMRHFVYVDDGSTAVIRGVPVDGPDDASIRLDHQPADGNGIDFLLSADGSLMVYRWNDGGSIELYAVDLAATFPAPAVTVHLYLPNLHR